jgi:hypothetical protein
MLSQMHVKPKIMNLVAIDGELRVAVSGRNSG